MPATSDSTLTYAPKSGIVRSLDTDLQQEYAQAAISTTLPPWAKGVLMDAAAGCEFDVWIFSQALVQALSACTTRDGASTARRARARKIRHLAYWANAIIEKTLTGAEPVEGRTSPALQAARDQLQASEASLHEAEEMIDRANQRIADLIREKTIAEARLETLGYLAGNRLKVLEYALRIMPPGTKMQVRGYQDALNDLNVS